LITVVAVAGPATVQDGGRPGRMQEGIPPGGPLVPELLARANAALGNADDEAGIELFGALTIAGDRGTLAATDDGTTYELGAPGEREPLHVACAGARVRYVAVRGGLDVPRVLGGRGTLLVAALGGHQGRLLRRGDMLPVGTAAARPRRDIAPPDLDAALRVVLGPDLDRFAPEAVDLLLTSVFQVTDRSDRVGVRLFGPPLPHAMRAGDEASASSPMVRGAIQVPPSGSPIVLGPDHPTTGGYPVLATVVRASLGSLGARCVGARLTFVAFVAFVA
jgi:biotin-dependent carboxylase-like uncharacterized protein